MSTKLKLYVKLYTLFILVFFLFSSNAGYSLSLDSLNKVSLNGTWKFKTDPYNEGEKDSWFKDERKKTHWYTQKVPGNWDVRNEYADYAGKAWYKEEFQVETTWESKIQTSIQAFFDYIVTVKKFTNLLIGSA